MSQQISQNSGYNVVNQHWRGQKRRSIFKIKTVSSLVWSEPEASGSAFYVLTDLCRRHAIVLHHDVDGRRGGEQNAASPPVLKRTREG